MSFKEFGTLVKENAHPNFREFGNVVEEPSRGKSLINAPIKGAIKKSADIAEFVSSAPGAKKLTQIPGPKELLGFGKDTKLIPEEARKYAEESFPTQEKELEKYLERAGGVGLEALLSPGGLVTKGAQTLVGAGLGYVAEKFNAPEWAQAIAEGIPFFYSGGKKIPLKASQKKLGEFLRKEGLSENQIAPLLKSEEQLNRWSKWAAKGNKSKELMDAIYQKTGNIYDNITDAGKKLPPLSNSAKTNLLKEMSVIIEDMPHKYRSLIKQDAKDLLTKGRGGFEDLKNFYTDLNSVIKSEEGGRAIVGRFKGPIKKAMESISPELAEDFGLATDFYRTRANVSAHLLNRRQLDDLLDLGEAATMAAGLYNRDMGLIGKVIGAAGAKKIAREMLINPRLQNKSIRIGEALKKNKYMLAEKYLREFSDEVSKDDPDLASTIPKTIRNQ